MKTLKRPLVLVSTLIFCSLLLSWKYFDDDATSISSSYSNNKEQLTDAELIAWMADTAGGDDEDQPPPAEDVLVQRIPGDNNHLLLMAYYSKENYSNPSFTIENGFTITLRDDGKGDDKTAGDGLYTAKIPADVQAFRKQAVSMLQQMKAYGYKPIGFMNRQRIIDPNATEGFDVEKFDAHEPVSVSGLNDALSEDLSSSSAAVSSAASTSVTAASATATAKPTLFDSLKKNSILITNLAVVEDTARTWNFCAQKGTVNGAWTFGALMRQLASKSPTTIATDAQL